MVSSGRTWGNAGVPGIYVVLLYDLLVALKLDAPTLLVGLGVSREWRSGRGGGGGGGSAVSVAGLCWCGGWVNRSPAAVSVTAFH